ncbi:MAG: metallophosphoesterase [Candidatus Angelobacter sp.]|jgi:predicted MPP superfamily phosphohydrolase
MMEAYQQATKFDFVIMLGDNIYGSHSPRDFVKKFEQPYKPLLDAGVKFYASLGNHDDPDDERLYKPFNMGVNAIMRFAKARPHSSRWTATTWIPDRSAGSTRT